MTREDAPCRYLVAGCRPWDRRTFEEVICRYPGAWTFAAAPGELSSALEQARNPRYVFFLHWSWKVPEDITSRYECVCFHMSDVPFGRGGSPLQNLILRGLRQTRLSALRMTPELDAGPVYLKADLCLEGSAEEIYLRGSRLAADLIRRIITEHPVPTPQTGEVVTFRRRQPPESRIPAASSLAALHDFLRMLDAEGYPRAFLDHQGYRYEFRRAVLCDGRIEADVTITPLPQEQSPCKSLS